MAEISTRAFLTELAQENGIPMERMESVIRKFEDEWYYTVGSLKELNSQQWNSIGIPLRVVDMIQKKLNEPQAEVSRKQVLLQLVSELMSLENGRQLLKDCVQTLQTIVLNIIKTSPIDDRVRRIKVTNPAFSRKVAQYKLALSFMEKIGFNLDSQLLYMAVPDYFQLREALVEINQIAQQLQIPIKEPPPVQQTEEAPFDPYKSSVMNVNPDQPSVYSRQHDPLKITNQIQQIQQTRRLRAQNTLIERNLRVFRVQGNNINQVIRALQNQEQQKNLDHEEERQIYLKQMQSLLREREAMSKFSNKRKKQLQRMQSTEFCMKATVRVRFPDCFVLEATFNVTETNRSLYNFVGECLQQCGRPFELFTAPPRKVVKFSNESLDPMSPSVVVNFSWKDLQETTAENGPFLRQDLMVMSLN